MVAPRFWRRSPVPDYVGAMLGAVSWRSGLVALRACALVALAGCARAEQRPQEPPASPTATQAPSAEVTNAVERAPSVDDSPEAQFEKALRAADPRLAAFMDRAKELRLQVLVTEVRPEGEAWPTHAYRADAEYFYPASAIKPLLATAALRYMKSKGKGPIDPLTRIVRCAKNKPGCEPPKADQDTDDAKPADGEVKDDDAPKKRKKLFVGEEIGNLLSYSDNDSYDRLYDIVGHRELNETIVALGFPEVRFQHRMSGPASTMRSTQAVRLLRPGGSPISLKARTSDLELPPIHAESLGIGSSYKGDRGLVDGPMDFGSKNYVPLHDLQRLLISLLFPDHAGVTDLGLEASERKLLTTPMTRVVEPNVKAADHNPLGPGVAEVIDAKRLHYVGKAGRAYGFLLESAYIEDTETHRAIFVAATVLSNADGVMNDDKYDYEDIGRPALRAVGAALAKLYLVDH
jgi:hypothetical protein